jgi:hypothetical protein
MNLQRQTSASSIEEINWGNAFRSRVVRANPKEAIPEPHWLCRFIAPPAGADAASEIRATVDQSAKNIAIWSSYLPADCVATMVSLGWDRTT